MHVINNTCSLDFSPFNHCQFFWLTSSGSVPYVKNIRARSISHSHRPLGRRHNVCVCEREISACVYHSCMYRNVCSVLSDSRHSSIPANPPALYLLFTLSKPMTQLFAAFSCQCSDLHLSCSTSFTSVASSEYEYPVLFS